MGVKFKMHVLWHLLWLGVLRSLSANNVIIKRPANKKTHPY